MTMGRRILCSDWSMPLTALKKKLVRCVTRKVFLFSVQLDDAVKKNIIALKGQVWPGVAWISLTSMGSRRKRMKLYKYQLNVLLGGFLV